MVFDIRGCLTNDIQVTRRTCSALSQASDTPVKWEHTNLRETRRSTQDSWQSCGNALLEAGPHNRQQLAQSHMTKHTFTGVSLDCILLHICFYLNCFWKAFMMMSQPKATVSFDQFIIQWKMCRVPHAEARTRGPTVFNALILSSSGDLI